MNVWLISSATALDFSYILPIAARRIFANHPEVQFKPGPFYMKGALGWAANIICISWTLFICVILSLPTDLPTNAQLFNYVRDIPLGIIMPSLITLTGRANYWLHYVAQWGVVLWWGAQDVQGTDRRAKPQSGPSQAGHYSGGNTRQLYQGR